MGGSAQSSDQNTFQFPLVGPQRQIARDVAAPLAAGGLGAFQGAAGIQQAQDPLLQQIIAQLTEQFGLDFSQLGARGDQGAALEAQQDALAAGQLGRLENFGALTPDEQALINAQQEAQFAAGSGLIQRGATQSLEGLRDVLAPSLGLRSTDTPILDRGGLVAREAVFQQGQLASGLAAQAAAQGLALPLQRDVATSGVAAGQQNILGGRQALSGALANRNLQAQLGLLGQGTQSGLGLAAVANVPGLLQASRPSQGGQSQSSGFTFDTNFTPFPG